MFHAYIMATRRNGTLYAGSTDGQIRRVWEHKNSVRPDCFTANYDVHLLVWFEPYETRGGAFLRERQIKEWRRAWKLNLIEQMNPDWDDLYEGLTSQLV